MELNRLFLYHWTAFIVIYTKKIGAKFSQTFALH